MIYETNDGGPGKVGPLTQVWKWLCEFTAESLPSPQVRGSTSASEGSVPYVVGVPMSTDLIGWLVVIVDHLAQTTRQSHDRISSSP